MHESRCVSKRGLAIALVVLGAASVPAESDSSADRDLSPVLVVRQLESSYELSIEGQPAFHTTSNLITNQRLILPTDSTLLVALWNEQATGKSQTTPYYAISFDGENFARVRSTTYDIRLLYDLFDPHVRTPSVPAALTADDNTDLYIVQFVTQPLEAYRSEIRHLGATVYNFIADHAHLVHMSQPVRADVAALPYVRWVGPFHPAYRLEPFLLDNLDQLETILPTQRYNIRVAQRGPRQKALVAGRIRDLGATVDAQIPDGFLLQATLTPKQLLTVIRWNEVLFVDRWGPPEPDMNIARQIGGADQIEIEAGFTGQGVRAEVMDGNVNGAHPDFASRPVIFHGPHSGANGHGTSTTGINFGDGSGNSAARGLLPDGQAIFADYDFLTNRYTHTAALAGFPYYAVFQSNSWGSPRTFFYDNTSAEFDDILFLNDILICQSQSNAGNQDSRPQAWAKNVVSVGGVFHFNTLDKTTDCWCGGASIGPASDGRIKPDLTHFYDSVLTLSGGGGYTQFSGTSSAAPITAGYFGLFFQMWHEGLFGNPRAGSAFHSRPHMTTSKAVVINTAEQYPFSGPSDDLTRVHQGWGMADLGYLYDERDLIFIVNETDVLTNLASTAYTLTVLPDGAEFRATLVYADPAGVPFSAQHRVNDLTLKVTAPDETVYYGNFGLLDGNYSLAGGGPNTIDTVENVFIADPTPGDWIVEVFADEINEDGHLETEALDVDYALVVSSVVGPRTPSSYFDADGDGDVDVWDYSQFLDCQTGPVGSDDYNGMIEGCAGADCDGDADVDFADFACFERSYSGDCGVAITRDLTDQFACASTTAVFELQVQGKNVQFAWFHDGDLLFGENGPTLVIDPVTVDSAGSYKCFLGSQCAMTDSAVAQLLVDVPPEITQDPDHLTVCFEEPAEFSITADGTGTIGYQWFLDGAIIPDADEPTYTIDSVTPDDLGWYHCVVTDECDLDIPSQAALLSVSIVEITGQPEGGTYCLGDTIVLLVLAEGLPDYQWFKDGKPVAGGTDFFLIVPDATLDDAGLYHVVATNECNTEVSKEADVQVITCGNKP